MSFSVALNLISDKHLTQIQEVFAAKGVREIFVAARTPNHTKAQYKIVPGYGIEFGTSLNYLIENCQSDFLILLLKPVDVELNQEFSEWLRWAANNNSCITYSAHQIFLDKETQVQPCIDYQFGSVRDDFDFGPLICINIPKAKELSKKYSNLLVDNATALYGLRLASSLESLPSRFTSISYVSKPIVQEDAHSSHFAYASAAGASSQKALESTFTEFSKIAGFYLGPTELAIDFNSQKFETEASIVIPVRNRLGKVEHAVKSALSQKSDSKFNVIVVDNHSSDGTTAALSDLAKEHKNLVHIIPERKDLGIGGCWQLAVEDSRCGRFALQLDSDDIYSSEFTLEKILTEFYRSKAAAIVGSYLLVDRELNPIPPGAIEHREWNDSNGHNNALRINGLGAPRAYFTPIIRKVGFPNVSYGEDYFAMLSISRSYKISRIYEHLYLCRRWEGNSDAAPSIEKMNGFNSYKDGIRSAEIEQRRKLAQNN